MLEFFAMGGYAFYVWTSYLVVGLIFGYLYVAPIRAHKTLLKELEHDDTQT